MFILETYSAAVIFCLITMLCWGSWANTQKLASSGWRFELFYWDYTIGILLFSLGLAFTLGSNGAQGRSFMADYAQADAANLQSALIGGVVFNIANILLVAAISIAGMSVAFPVGIGLALVIGVVVNYIDAPAGNVLLLFGGVALVTAAILLNANAYRKLSSTTAGVSTKGLLLSVIAGVLMGFFYKYVAQSMTVNFAAPETGKLTPYTALVFFAIGIFLSNFVFNTVLMYRPFVGKPTSFAAYFKGSGRDHLMGVLGGMIWNAGMSFSILAAEKASPAISYGLGQGATIVAAVWGIYIWKEFKNAPKGTNNLLNMMLLCYILGLGMIILAR
ncbi:GRP family sugar transporter [Runella slithyformis]|uniref:Integral membrane protein sugar permease n=1 Tax=Runella slithyformis (strain ATCC 29530 / DSM 19594 / LMG 11500 / NCIMB 11436 / LSU 4) TaxID=761193 RepID=A0A7U3ZPN6_RUNSL|nr:GRP family sugar transporter [Runella slithyformis]AEI51070.1 integral membrane protein; sugar permease [Runella slithyformis DSM 19594]